MQSSTWIGGQYPQMGPPSQAAPQLTNNTMLNQHAGTLNNSCQYRTLNRGAQRPQSAHFAFHNGIYFNTKTSNWQTSTIPHQTGSSQQQARGGTNSYYQKVFHDKQQSISVNTQNGNPPVTSGLQIATQQDFHRGSLRPHNMMKANTLYPQQEIPSHLIQSQWRQDANVVSDPKHCKLLKNMLLNENGESIELVSPYATTATSLPSYNLAVSQSKRSNMATKTSSAQILQVSSVSQKTQQYQVQLNTTCNGAEEATHQIIARIADDLRRSAPPTSDGCPPGYASSLYKGNQCVSEVWSLEPAIFNVSESYNLNASQIVSVSKTSLGKPNHSGISRTQHSVAAPQPSSVPNQVFNVTATGDCHGKIRQRSDNGVKAADAIFPLNNRYSKDNPVGSISAASQFRELTKNISQNINKTISSAANNNDIREMREMLTTVKGSDGSVHASPGRTGARAVAVVQPLSQVRYQAASKCISSAKISQLADKSVINHLAVSSDSSLVSSSDSAGHQDVSQKRFGADDTGLERTNKTQVDQHVASAAQELVTNDVDKSQNPTDPNPLVFELSFAPAIPWTMGALTRLILDEEKAQLKLSKDLAPHNSSNKLISMFWDGTIKNLACKLKGGWYKGLVTDVASFCNKQVTSDSVILSQVKNSFEKQFQSYHVLKDDEVYSVPPYKSPWLNVNEQLDEIDKEFGFPWSLKRRSHMLESHSEPDQVWTVNSIPAEIASEVPNEVLPQMELEPAGSGEEKQSSCVEVTSIQAASPNESIDAIDPYCSIQIQVLPPEEAKIMFEQVQRKMQQCMETDIQQEGVMASSVEAVDITVNDPKRMKESVCPIEEVCCISKWMEQICAPGTPLSKCQCKNEQSPTDCTDNSLNKEVMSGHGHDGLRVIMSDSRFFTGENQVTIGENVNNQIMTCSQSELRNEPIASTENDHKFYCPDKEPNNISQKSPNSSPSIILRSEKDGDLSISDTEIRLDPEADCIQGQFKSTEGTQSRTAVSCDMEFETPPSSGREVANQIADLEENCAPAQLKTTNVALQSSLETEKQSKSSEMAAIQETLILSSKCEPVERKRKRLSSPGQFFPIFKKQKNKCKPSGDVDSKPSTNSKDLVDPTERETLATNVRAVQLVLFGSASQKKCGLTDSRKRRVSAPAVVSDGGLKPPEVLAVKLNPLRRKSSESLPECSVKQRVYEKWRSFKPTSSRHRRKQKTQKCASAPLSGASLKRGSMVGPTNTKKPPVSSDLSNRNWKRNATQCMSLKRKRAFSDQPRQGKEKMQRNVVTVNQRSRSEDKSHVIKPVQETSVLKFSVLPNTFNFKDGSNQRKETKDPVPNLPAHIEGRDENSIKTDKRKIGTWCPNHEKKYLPLCKLTLPTTSGIFQEFQKKYMKKTRSSMDE